MNIKIKSTKLELTDAIRGYVEEKINMLEKYLGNIPVINCDFEVERMTGHHKGEVFRAEVNLEVPGEVLRVEKSEEDLYKAIDKVKDHLELAIIKHREKKIDRRRS